MCVKVVPHRSPKRPLHKAVKITPLLVLRPEGVEDARVMGYKPRKAAKWVWNQSNIQRMLQSTKLKRVGDLKIPFDVTW